MITVNTVNEIFLNVLSGMPVVSKPNDRIEGLLLEILQTNERIWHLEDLARIKTNKYKTIAIIKRQIDSINQQRNDLITKLDVELFNRMSLAKNQGGRFCSESPGMLLDRISILYIKRHQINLLIRSILEPDVRAEYMNKSSVANQQIDDLSSYFKSYMEEIGNGLSWFKVYDGLKIYNDENIKGFINHQKLF